MELKIRPRGTSLRLIVSCEWAISLTLIRQLSGRPHIWLRDLPKAVDDDLETDVDIFW